MAYDVPPWPRTNQTVVSLLDHFKPPVPNGLSRTLPVLLWNSENREHMTNFRNVDCVGIDCWLNWEFPETYLGDFSWYLYLGLAESLYLTHECAQVRLPINSVFFYAFIDFSMNIITQV